MRDIRERVESSKKNKEQDTQSVCQPLESSSTLTIERHAMPNTTQRRGGLSCARIGGRRATIDPEAKKRELPNDRLNYFWD